MSELLALASDYIERMSNPVYGVSTNEAYALKFATLLRSDGFETSLAAEIRSLKDPTTLTSFGWLWLFGWARANDIKLDEGLLVALYEEWSSEFVRAVILELATEDLQNRRESINGRSPNERPDDFLSRIISLATHVPEVPSEEDFPDRESNGTFRQSNGGRSREEDLSESEPSTELAESTLIALLQVGSDTTINAAQELLQRQWPGRSRLLESFWEIFDGLDADTQRVWLALFPLQRPESPFT